MQSEQNNKSSKMIKALFIDDNYDYYKVLKMSLENKIELDYAPDGFSALHMAQKEAYDIILCDVYMPYIDGIKLLSEFTRKHLSIPFILITGNIEEKISREALQAGAYNLMEKPIRVADLLEKIDKAIELHSSQQVMSLCDQEKAHIYNMLKLYYYDVEKIMLSIQHFQIPLTSVQVEIEKKVKTGKCIFDDLQNLKYYH
ncbi:MAG: response regulator [Oligoflexales bacterium]|nr:response regulator [Oligoflexales bacterium]